MAQWISACLFALSANIDNFPIGIVYGLRGMRIGALYREAQGGMGAPEQPPADACGTRLGLRESAALAAALMVNNVGFGVGARITGLSIVKTTACTFVCSLILLAGGAAVGRRFGGGHLGRYAGVCSAALIVALGVYELFI